MGSLNHFKIRASSLTESIMAMVIVAVCLSIALVVYVNVLQANRDLPFYVAEQKVKELLWSGGDGLLLEDEDYSFPIYSIHKTVEKINGLNDAYKVIFTVQMPKNQKSYEYVVIQ